MPVQHGLKATIFGLFDLGKVKRPELCRIIFRHGSRAMIVNVGIVASVSRH